jgi:hypothetical protein
MEKTKPNKKFDWLIVCRHGSSLARSQSLFPEGCVLAALEVLTNTHHTIQEVELRLAKKKKC